jgi:hypothetical protein
MFHCPACDYDCLNWYRRSTQTPSSVLLAAVFRSTDLGTTTNCPRCGHTFVSYGAPADRSQGRGELSTGQH